MQQSKPGPGLILAGRALFWQGREKINTFVCGMIYWQTRNGFLQQAVSAVGAGGAATRAKGRNFFLSLNLNTNKCCGVASWEAEQKNIRTRDTRKRKLFQVQKHFLVLR